MKLKYLNKVFLITTFIILSGCGGGGGDSPSSSTSNKPTVALVPPPSTPSSSNSNKPSSSTSNSPSSSTSNSTLLAKDEPYYKYSWHIDSKNSVLNTKGYPIDQKADINILEAWKITKGKGVKVAVIDPEGFDIDHEDLKANICNTYNVISKNEDVSSPNISIEESQHGNTCAGFLVAPINGKGIIGTAPESKLIAIKMGKDVFDTDIIKAFEHAKQQGAKVISCSWGTGNISASLTNKLKSLYDDGITVLFSSGNDDRNLDNITEKYPANHIDESESEWVLGIGASAENNDRALYSNYGKEIDFLAPGGGNFYEDEIKLGLLGIDDSGNKGSTRQLNFVNNNYAFGSGTSYATPIVAGVVALMYAINPSITPKQIRDILIKTSTKIGGTDAKYAHGFDEKRAYGKINAGEAVKEAQKLFNQ